ncbi:MAG: hypothetical protein AB9879_10015 [Methanothrix sp.]
MNEDARKSPVNIKEFNDACDFITKGRSEDLEKIIKKFKDFIARDSSIELNARRWMGIIYMNFEEYHKASFEFQYILSALENEKQFKNNLDVQDSSDPMIHQEILKSMTYHDLGLVLSEKKMYDDAESSFNSAIDIIKRIASGKIGKNELIIDDNLKKGLNGKLAWYRNDLGGLFLQKSDYNNSIRQYNHVLELAPLPDDYPKGYPYLFRGLARRYLDKDKAKKDFDQSIHEFNVILGKKPDKSIEKRTLLAIADAHTNRARIYLDYKDYHNAKEDLNLARDLYLTNLDIAYDSYSVREFNKTIDNLSTIHSLIGKYYYLKNQNEDAIIQFEQAMNYVKSSFNKSRILNNIGCVYQKEKNIPNAKDYYLKAIKEYPDWDTPKDNLKLVLDSAGKECDLFEWWLKKYRWILAAFLIIVLSFAIIIPPISIENSNETNTEISFNNMSYNDFAKVAGIFSSNGDPGYFKSLDQNIKLENYSKFNGKITTKTNPAMERRYMLIALILLILLLPVLESLKTGPLEIKLKEGKIETGGPSPSMEGSMAA